MSSVRTRSCVRSSCSSGLAVSASATAASYSAAKGTTSSVSVGWIGVIVGCSITVLSAARAPTTSFSARSDSARSIFEIDLGPQHLELGSDAGRAPVPRVIGVRLLGLDVRANDAQLLNREQQLVVGPYRVEGGYLTRPLRILLTGDARGARGLNRLVQLEAEQRLPHVCGRRKSVRRNRRQRVPEFRRKFIEPRAVQQRRIPEAREAGIPGDLRESIGFRLDDTAFEQRDLVEAELDSWICRKRLGHRLGP